MILKCATSEVVFYLPTGLTELWTNPLLPRITQARLWAPSYRGLTSGRQPVIKFCQLLGSFTGSSQPQMMERMARVNAAWEAMNIGLPSKVPKTLMSKPTLMGNKTTKKTTPGWMVALGLASKRTSATQGFQQKRPNDVTDGASEDSKKLAAAALSAVRDVASVSTSAGRGKVEITEIRDFAGEEIEVKKFVDVDSKEAAEKAKTTGPPSALDSVLEQIKKKPKLSVLDKTKKDWGEFKEDTKGLEDELDAYKKSSNQYLDKVSFLQRTDIREFERERDARLAMQAKRRLEMREDDL